MRYYARFESFLLRDTSGAVRRFAEDSIPVSLDTRPNRRVPFDRESSGSETAATIDAKNGLTEFPDVQHLHHDRFMGGGTQATTI
jgi:hypothetical protein